MNIHSIIVLSAFVLAATAAQAHDYSVGQLAIAHPWTRATPQGAKVGGGYLSVTNNGNEADRLMGVAATSAGQAEIHEMKTENGVMTMRPINDGVEIKPGETVALKPGGYHIMFMNLKEPFKPGEPVKGELEFQKAGKVQVEFKVEPVGAAGPGGDMAGHKH